MILVRQGIGSIKMSQKVRSRDIPEITQRMLWAKAAGRCEFAGCNTLLGKSSVTQEKVNKSQMAHIYSFSNEGPRGNTGTSDEMINDSDNLMLVCHQCHQKMDKEKDGGRYTVELLRAWKKSHERRIEIVTAIDSERHSHILLYGAGIGQHNSPLSYKSAAEAVFPDRYPADDKPIEIPSLNSWHTDRDEAFWRLENEHLFKMFKRRVRERLNDGEVKHLSVFALAPQPLLIRLGSLLTDIPEVDVFQRHREPQTWKWQTQQDNLEFIVEEPLEILGPPALVLSLSANVSDDRIKAVIGEDISLWKISIPYPNNDFLQSKEQLRKFRIIIRQLFQRIKGIHGQNSYISVFPAMPVAMAVEFGRVRQPKADLPLKIYDQLNDRGGFVPATDINFAPGDE